MIFDNLLYTIHASNIQKTHKHGYICWKEDGSEWILHFIADFTGNKFFQ